MEKAMQSLQELPVDERDAVILDMQNVLSAGKSLFGFDINKTVGGWSQRVKNKMFDNQEEINATRNKYETNIIDDIGQGDFGQAALRIVEGVAESAPLLLATVAGGGTGLVAMGSTVASAKLEELERSGEDVDLKALTNGALRGASEIAGGRVLQGMFKPFIGKVTPEVAKRLSGGYVGRLKQLGRNMGTEFLEESSQQVQEELTDLLLQGKPLEGGWTNLWKRSIDAGLIGAASAGPSALAPTPTTNETDTTTETDTPTETPEVETTESEEVDTTESEIEETPETPETPEVTEQVVPEEAITELAEKGYKPQFTTAKEGIEKSGIFVENMSEEETNIFMEKHGLEKADPVDIEGFKVDKPKLKKIYPPSKSEVSKAKDLESAAQKANEIDQQAKEIQAIMKCL
jgi:hypothetical protein